MSGRTKYELELSTMTLWGPSLFTSPEDLEAMINDMMRFSGNLSHAGYIIEDEPRRTWNIPHNHQPRETAQQRAIRNPENFVRTHMGLNYNLDFAFNDLGDTGIAAISSYFHIVAVGAKILDLEHNNIGVTGIQALMPYLSQLINLKTLILEGNPIGNEGLHILASCLQNLPNLKSIIIGESNLTDAGIIDLIPYLPERFGLGSIGSFLGNAGKSALRAAGFTPVGMDWHRR